MFCARHDALERVARVAEVAHVLDLDRRRDEEAVLRSRTSPRLSSLRSIVLGLQLQDRLRLARVHDEVDLVARRADRHHHEVVEGEERADEANSSRFGRLQDRASRRSACPGSPCPAGPRRSGLSVAWPTTSGTPRSSIGSVSAISTSGSSARRDGARRRKRRAAARPTAAARSGTPIGTQHSHHRISHAAVTPRSSAAGAPTRTWTRTSRVPSPGMAVGARIERSRTGRPARPPGTLGRHRLDAGRSRGRPAAHP